MKNALVDQRPIRFAVNGRSVHVRVRSSDRAKTMRITVGPRRPLEVVVPTGTTEERIQRFLHQKRRWIDDKVASSEAIANRPSVLGLDKTGVVWIGGRPLEVQRRIGGRPIARAAEPSMLTVSGPATRHADAIERWYRRQARCHIARSVQHESARLALKYAAIGIRDPRTRWGSCSRSGHLSFSWRLVLTPPEILRYVVVHELCHLVEPNHSKAFWRTLEAAQPGWQASARWLRRHGHELHVYDPQVALLPGDGAE